MLALILSLNLEGISIVKGGKEMWYQDGLGFPYGHDPQIGRADSGVEEGITRGASDRPDRERIHVPSSRFNIDEASPGGKSDGGDYIDALLI